MKLGPIKLADFGVTEETDRGGSYCTDINLPEEATCLENLWYVFIGFMASVYT